MDYNLHTHTYRCNHAIGTEEEYIEYAIGNGIKHMGFSDHIPFKKQDFLESNYRVPESKVKDYAEKINSLKKKYENKVKLYLGFEMEYYPDSFEYMLNKAKEYGGEYLILGQHFLDEEYKGGKYCGQDNYEENDLKIYVSRIIEGMKTGAFTYVAHPDVFNFLGDIELYKKEMRRICIASKKYDIPLEINFLGIRYHRHYPIDEFWQIAGEIGCPVVFGCDAHDVEGAFYKESLQKAKEIVKKHNLNYIGMPKIIFIG